MNSTSAYPDGAREPIDWELTAQALAEGELLDGWRLVDSSGFARVAHHPEQGVFYKLFLPRSPLERLKAILRGSRATRARRHNDELRYAGINAPLNVAWGQLPQNREYLISTAVPGAGVDHWLLRTLATTGTQQGRQRNALMQQLGVFIGRLHHSGFVHGDLRTGNVLAEVRGGRFQFALIDNERNSRHDMPPGKLLLKNLMQLNMHTPDELSRRERWRFFAAWRRQMRELSDTEARLLAQEAFQWAMRRLDAKGKLSDNHEGRPA